MANIDCCNSLQNPLARFLNFTDNGDGLVTSQFEFQSFEGGGNQNCGSGVHLTFQRDNGTFFGGFTFAEGSDFAVDMPTSNALDWAIIKPYISGSVTNGGTISVLSLDLMKTLGLFEGAIGGETSTLEIGVSILDCVTNELSNNTDNKMVFTEIYEPPVSRVTSNYIGTTSQGEIEGSFHLKEYDDTTALISTDLVRVSMVGKDTGVVFGQATFNYGDDLSSSTPIQDSNFVSNLQPYFVAGSTLTDGGNYTFLKKPASMNLGTYGINIGEEWDFIIEAYDDSQCAWNENSDNYDALNKLYITTGFGSVQTKNPGENPLGDKVVTYLIGTSYPLLNNGLDAPEQISSNDENNILINESWSPPLRYGGRRVFKNLHRDTSGIFKYTVEASHNIFQGFILTESLRHYSEKWISPTGGTGFNSWGNGSSLNELTGSIDYLVNIESTESTQMADSTLLYIADNPLETAILGNNYHTALVTTGTTITYNFNPNEEGIYNTIGVASALGVEIARQENQLIKFSY